MKNWLIYEPPGGAAPTLEGAERFVVVPEGFSRVAFFLPLIWLPLKRCWLGLGLYLAAEIALFLLASVAGLRGGSLLTLALLPNVAVGLEASWLRARSLERRGYTLAGSLFARDREAAEAAFFQEWTAGGPAEAVAARPAAAPYRPPQAAVLGLFPEPRAR